MNQNRRAFLKTTAGAGVMAATGGAAAAAVVETAPTEAIAPIAAAAPKPYFDYPWKWFVSHDGETFSEDFATKEAALACAQDQGYAIVAECQQQDFSLQFDGWRILEQLNDDNMELVGEGEGIECAADQERDLGEMVTAAIEAWAVKHKISLTAWTFASVRNKTELTSSAGMTEG